jgi:hypothetical protein
MDRRAFLKALPALAAVAVTTRAVAQSSTAGGQSADAIEPILLPPPAADGGKSVLAALWERRTIRSIASRPLPKQMLSNLLFAAWGVNRENGPGGRVGRTAASASNSQEIDLYVVLPNGAYLYQAVPHRLSPVAAGDHRAAVGGARGSDNPATAPVILLLVADLARYNSDRSEDPAQMDSPTQQSYNVAAGLIAGNVYLFAASQGLAAWLHTCNKGALARVLNTRPEQRILYAQTVGYPR